MCSQCDQIDVKICHLKTCPIECQQTLDRIAALVSELEVKKIELHSELALQLLS